VDTEYEENERGRREKDEFRRRSTNQTEMNLARVQERLAVRKMTEVMRKTRDSTPQNKYNGDTIFIPVWFGLFVYSFIHYMVTLFKPFPISTQVVQN